MNKEYRIEKDFLGKKRIKNDHYYGIQTARAKENFDVTRTTISLFPNFITSLIEVKKAAALTNYELGDLTKEQKDAIVQACDEIINRKFHDQFIVDPIQGGAGTSTNMNANEVIANRALEILKKKKGSYHIIHPNNHVNYSQSTNDVYPTAIKITLYKLITKLRNSLQYLGNSFHKKADEFKDILKIGRTQLQDAVPMTLGQEFKTYAIMIDEDIIRLTQTKLLLKEVNLGATAIGTAINTKPQYQKNVIKNLQNITGIDLFSAGDLIESTQDTGVFVHISGILKSIAIRISKICNDLRLLSSGPRAGLNEINLPPMQPGSSIMPGKVNPVMPEVINQVAFDVIGTDMTISIACESGQLQLNVFEPIIAYKLFTSINIMRRTFYTFTNKCVNGITANKDICMEHVVNCVSIVTALNPILGYEQSASLAKEALKTDKTVYDIVLEKKLFTKEKLDEILRPENMLKSCKTYH